MGKSSSHLCGAAAPVVLHMQSDVAAVVKSFLEPEGFYHSCKELQTLM